MVKHRRHKARHKDSPRKEIRTGPPTGPIKAITDSPTGKEYKWLENRVESGMLTAVSATTGMGGGVTPRTQKLDICITAAVPPVRKNSSDVACQVQRPSYDPCKG